MGTILMMHRWFQSTPSSLNEGEVNVYMTGFIARKFQSTPSSLNEGEASVITCCHQKEKQDLNAKALF